MENVTQAVVYHSEDNMIFSFDRRRWPSLAADIIFQCSLFETGVLLVSSRQADGVAVCQLMVHSCHKAGEL